MSDQQVEDDPGQDSLIHNVKILQNKQNALAVFLTSLLEADDVQLAAELLQLAFRFEKNVVGLNI